LKDTGIGILINWATLQSLANLRKQKTVQDFVIVEWKAIELTPAYSQHFIIPNLESFIQAVVGNMRSHGAKVERKQKKLIPEEAVRPEAMIAINIEQIE